MFQMISPKEAKQRFESEEQVNILDVRSEAEYEQGHIPGALLLPLDQLEDEIANCFPNKETRIYVYCRSGVRSKIAARLLDQMGYQQIYEFGGILDWPFEVVRGE